MTDWYYNSLEDELLRYNQHLSDVGHIDVELEYHMSSNEGSIWGASINWNVQKMQNVSQLFGYLAFSSGMNYMEGYNNPPVSKVSLDPKVRLDQAEIYSLNGFRTYDYIPISPESLAKNPGEVIPSLNAALVKGAGVPVFHLH